MNFTPKKNTGLGKGLSALIREELNADGTLKDEVRSDTPIAKIPIDQIRANPFQPRKEFEPQALEELKQSILQNGIIQPITVRKTATGYELIAGERRFRASKLAGLTELPAYIRENVTDQEMLELAIIENVQREKLNPIELAEGYQLLIETCNLTQDQVAQKIGKDRTTITNIIRLLKLPADIQESLKKEEITIGHGRALIALPSEQLQLKAWKQIVDGGMSVRKTEQLVKTTLEELEGKSHKVSPNKYEIESAQPANPHIADVEGRLRMKLGTKVRLHHHKDGSGSVEIEYYSNDDLQRVIEMIETIRG
ncbi:ParB/RepB/Spo0J family partition protein [bacterium]|nr:ParB/RepB/Spo0J family partition protein [bacterium]NUN46625.1 ParB/RepB/Spo0J family partition protein [bacterium]HMW34068.1 ParB/RepB/Spo0J family partition protein [bacterium]HMW37290.1 ParB/RepB/Spo0J family partition protein [bacterium]HMY36347.1 ParB/RepB/Spo0J family partition protein [bacterium]